MRLLNDVFNHFLKFVRGFSLLIFIFISGCNKGSYEFNYVDPEEKGFSGEKLKNLEEHLDKSGSSAMMILVDGDVIFDWGETKKKHTIHSIRKALINSLYGIAVNNDIIDTSATLKDLNINDITPELSENELNAQIIELLKSRSGVYHHAAGVSKGMLRGMPVRDSFKPGEHYYYNNWDFNVLGAILEQKTGKSIYELFYNQIAKPLEMHDYKGKFSSINGESVDTRIPHTDGFYQYEQSKSRYPAYHFRMSARDLALYGQLYLNDGKWEGEQIIPKEWIELSTQPYSVYNPDYGISYGMLWYVLMPGEQRRSKSFYHTGLGIHMLAVYPASNMVMIHRVDTENDFTYNKSDFYKMIGLLWEAKTN